MVQPVIPPFAGAHGFRSAAEGVEARVLADDAVPNDCYGSA